MAYKTLYRKYRPNNFDDVYGQDFIIKTLKNSILNNKICHAYLFAGSRGTGKTTVAKIFAKMINCLNPSDNLPCGICEVCLNENVDEIADIIEIDAASNNGVDEIRELKNKIKLVPVLCKYKVYIIDEVHMLSTGAFNALLKTLEEPPAHVIFILATTEPQKLPITIISRCQRFDFKRISVEDITKRLNDISQKEGIVITKEAISEIATISDGALRDAIGLLDQISSFSDKQIDINDIYLVGGNVSYDTTCSLVEAYFEEDIVKSLNIVEKVYLEGKDFYKLSERILFLFRNILIQKKAKQYFDSKDILLKEWINDVSKMVKTKELEQSIELLEELLRNVKYSNHPRILFEMFLLNRIKEDAEKRKEEIEVKSELKEKPRQEDKKDVITIEENPVTNEIKINFDYDSEHKKAIINNTIAQADNNSKKTIQNMFLNLDKYLTDKKYKVVASILKDASVAAASQDHILLTYKYVGMVENNDKEINKIRNFVKELFEKEYTIVAITEDDWKKERPYYIELKKKNGSIDILEEKTLSENFGGGITSEKEDVIIDEAIQIFGKELIEME